MSIAPAPSANPVPTTLLTSLLSFQTIQATRHSLLIELETSLSTYLLPPITTSIPEDLPTGERPSCASEVLDLPTLSKEDIILDPLNTIKIRAPNTEELGEILRIGFLGILEINNDLSKLELELKEKYNRTDLSKIVEKVKKLEEERFKLSIERDQLRRLSVLESERDFSIPIKEMEKKRQDLSMEIYEESQEIIAEIAELQHVE